MSIHASPIILVMFVLWTLSTGCRPTGAVTGMDPKQSLKSVGHYTIPLDQLTGFYADCIQLGRDSTQQLKLFLLYKRDNKVNVYDFASRKLERVLRFPSEGPNGVGTALSGFLWVSEEEVYLYNYWERTIFLATADGRVKKTYVFNDEDLSYPVLEPNSLRPIIKHNRHLFLAGYVYETLPPGQLDHPIVRLNMNDSTTSLIGAFPEKLYEGDWNIKAQTHFDFDPESGRFIISHAISDSLVLTDFSGFHRKEVADSKFIDEIQPINSDYQFQGSRDEEYTYDISSTYWAVKYDPRKEIYYRFGIIGRTLKEFNTGIPPAFFIMFFDKDLNFLGEDLLPEDVNPSMCFIGPQGLYIANKNAYDTNEDTLTFDIYGLARNQSATREK